MRTLALSLVVASVALAQAKPAGLTPAEMKEAEGYVKDCLQARTWEEKQAVLAKLAAIDRPSKADVGKIAAKAFQWAKAGARIDGGGKQKCSHPDFPGEYELVTGGAKGGKPTGVFICLHGGGAGVGDGAQIRGLFGQPGGGMIHVFPTVIQKDDSAWNTEREEQYVLAILEDLKRTFTVDTNRVYLAGHSMGGYGTWSIGPRHADVFAALSPQAGGIFVGGQDGDGKLIIAKGILPNLKNLPIWFYNSTDDRQVRPDSSIRAAEILEELRTKYGAFDFVWKKYTDIGHGTPKEGLADIWKWMLAKKRDPLPRRVLWETTRPYKRHFYWLRSESGGKFDVARDGNRFTVTEGGAGLRIMLNDRMVKMDQPIVVVDAGGKELFNGPATYSLVATLESIDVKKDPEMWFSGWVELK
jgi:predicted esterase